MNKDSFKKLTLFLSIFLIILIVITIILEQHSDNIMYSNNIVSNNGVLTMMLETDIDSNQYEAATSGDWPESGYIFNAEMSGCERGGTLSWNNEANKVVMESLDPDKCYVYFDRYNSAVVNNVTASNITNNSITLTVDVTEGENSIATYYFSNDNGESYVESNANTYTFSNLSIGTEYNFKVYVMDSNGIRSNTYSLSESTLTTMYLADYIKNNVYTGIDGDNGIFYHDGVGSYTNVAQEAGDYSYRYAGANPDNYVCFGSDESTCPNGNLYRIIGVFGNQVKLIKSTSLGNYYWSGSSSNSDNNWSSSTLNTGTLNGTYLNGLGTTWSDMIETTSWKVGGGHYNYLSYGTPKTAYNYELGNNSSNTTYNAKIGMMYVTDYYYAASPTYWSYVGFSSSGASYDYRAATGSNWMYLGLGEWTISRRSDITYTEFYVDSAGYVLYSDLVNYYYGVRPCFYLKSNVAITSGDGSSSNPYRVNLG